MRIHWTQKSARFHSALMFASIVATGFPGCARAQDLLRVDGHTITLTEVEAANAAAASNTLVREKVAQQLAQQQLLADTATDVPENQTARITAAQHNLRRQILAQWAADQYLAAHPISEQALKAAYEKTMASFSARQFWVRWIVVKTPKDAKDVIGSLRDGKEGFAALAVQRSIGQNAEFGGALGWQDEQTLPAALVPVLRKLKVGEVAGPVALDSGFGIIQLVAERDVTRPTLDQAKPQLELQLRNDALQRHIQDLAKSAKIENLMQGSDGQSQTETSHGK